MSVKSNVHISNPKTDTDVNNDTENYFVQLLNCWVFLVSLLQGIALFLSLEQF